MTTYMLNEDQQLSLQDSVNYKKLIKAKHKLKRAQVWSWGVRTSRNIGDSLTVGGHSFRIVDDADIRGELKARKGV